MEVRYIMADPNMKRTSLVTNALGGLLSASRRDSGGFLP
jgi:hypothetical protein